VIYLRVLVSLKSVFSDGQDVKYDCDITPHPHLFHGTNSHERSAQRHNTVNKTWKWRGRSTLLLVRGMSRLTYCLQIVAENPPTPQQHCQVEVWPLVVENIAKSFEEFFFWCFAATQLARQLQHFHQKKLGGKLKSDRFWLFFGHDCDLNPLPRTPGGCFSDSLRLWF